MSEQQPSADPTPVEMPGLETPAAPHEAADPIVEATPPTTETGDARPAGVPAKFWDADANALRTDALLKSYRELERKLGSMVALPSGADDHDGQQRLRRALGMPETAADYVIEAKDELIAPDPDLNAKLHEAGFTQAQAQMVYDLAAEHMLPALDVALAEVQAERNAERLAQHFGGADAWRANAQQIATWGEANLPADVFATLATDYDGVLAMHQMMQAREPAVLQDSEGPAGDVQAGGLTQMMRDPRYWRDRDPTFVAKVTEGFKRLYPS